ncbi:MAG: lipid II flippase MurJ, partial [Alphaproteobacteria bacterium]|nr:lipid II flippase MurJ [Alphaproteobacteria bacterium]
ASLLQEGSVSYLYFADRVNQLPLGVIGIAVGVALLPLLTRQLRSGDHSAAMDSMNRALEISLLLTLPAAVALAVMPWPIVTVLFERGAFGPEASVATAHALQAYALGLPAYVLIKTLSPGFFAREDTKTPVKIAMSAVILNIIIAITLMQIFRDVGAIALATTITSWVNVAVLGFILNRRGHLKLDNRLKKVTLKVLFSASLMGLWLYFIRTYSDDLILDGSLTLRIAVIAGLVLSGGLIYAIAVQMTGAARLSDVKAMLKRNKA